MKKQLENNLKAELLKDLTTLKSYIESKSTIDGYFIVVNETNKDYFYTWNFFNSPANIIYLVTLCFHEFKSRIVKIVSMCCDQIKLTSSTNDKSKLN